VREEGSIIFKGGEMPAYLIGHITVRDPVLWDVYVEGVRNSLLPFDGRTLFR
jgi:uncharacterized protein (DUF1330 family)